MQVFSNDRLGHFALWLWAIVTVYIQWNRWSLDATALYFSAYFYDLGQWGLVYSPDPGFFWDKHYPPEWLALAKSQGDATGNMSPYVYPPLWAALLAPLASRLTVVSFFNVVNIVNLVATVGSVYLAYGMIRPQKISFTIWSLVSIALLQFTFIGALAISLGQPQVFVTFLIIAAFRALLANKDGLAGAVLAFAAAIKIAPGFLAVVLIMERRWRALAAFLVAGAAFAGLSLIVAGPDLHREMLIRLKDLNSKVLIAPVNLTIDSVLLQISNWLNGTPGWGVSRYLIQAKPGWLPWVTKLLLILGLALAYVSTKQLHPGRRIWFRLQLVYLVFLITGPLAWTHYLYLTILLLPGVLTLASLRFAAAFLLVFAAFFSSAAYWFLFPLEIGPYVQLFSAFLMALATIGVLLWLTQQQNESP